MAVFRLVLAQFVLLSVVCVPLVSLHLFFVLGIFTMWSPQFWKRLFTNIPRPRQLPLSSSMISTASRLLLLLAYSFHILQHFLVLPLAWTRLSWALAFFSLSRAFVFLSMSSFPSLTPSIVVPFSPFVGFPLLGNSNCRFPDSVVFRCSHG